MLINISVEDVEKMFNRKFFPHNFILHWTDYEDTNLLVNLLKECKLILELGTYLGFTTENLANNTISDKIVTVDIVKELHSSITKFQEHEFLSISDSGKMIKNSKVEKIHKSTDEFFSACKDKFDGIFIDASHDYEQVMRDSNNALKFLSPGGVIVWHDVYNFDNSCDKCKAEPPNHGVVDALRDLSLQAYKIEKSWIAFHKSTV